jgi:alpha/beta superfamily hydrolase
MVARGQVLERMVTFVGPDGAPREGLWQGGGVLDGGDHARPVLVCPPHPRLGGAMDSPVCAELVWNLGLRRHPTLRFNYGGVGASQGALADLPFLPAEAPLAPADLAALVDDARAALAHLLASTGQKSAHVVGVSVGAIVAAALVGEGVDDDRVASVACVAPPTGVVPVVGVVGGGDGRGAIVVGDRAVVYVGADDAFVDVAALLGLVPVVIPHANHTFLRGLPQLAAQVCAQFADGIDDGIDLDVSGVSEFTTRHGHHSPTPEERGLGEFVVEHGGKDVDDDGLDGLDAAALRDRLRQQPRDRSRR